MNKHILLANPKRYWHITPCFKVAGQHIAIYAIYFRIIALQEIATQPQQSESVAHRFAKEHRRNCQRRATGYISRPFERISQAFHALITLRIIPPCRTREKSEM